jgi:uncharacterized damage-inducible protein DinB
MPARQPLDLPREIVTEFDRALGVTEYLVEVIPDALWRAKPEGFEGRTIAAVVAHIQSVRRMFAKMGGATPVPPALDRLKSSRADAVKALAASRQAYTTLFERALASGSARVKGQPRRLVNMAFYVVQHDSHHRGQVTMLLRALDHRLGSEEVMRMWGWKRLPATE